jgi:hypothetical protein
MKPDQASRVFRRRVGIISLLMPKWITLSPPMTINSTTRFESRPVKDTKAVLEELNNILSSHQFKNSKRYPALLSHLVHKMLEGETDQLKERTLGIEVFGRDPDYDTNQDPIIRVTAAEIRKKIAQFYHERGKKSRLQIDLPLGSYIPEFRRFDISPTLPSDDSQPTDSSGNGIRATGEREKGFAESQGNICDAHPQALWSLTKSHVAWLVAFTIASVCIGVYALNGHVVHSASDEFWTPLLNSPGAVLAVIPTSLRANDGSSSEGNPVAVVSSSHGPYSNISVCDAIALSRFSSLLGRHSKPFDIKEANLTSLVDLHERSAILIGALNNQWTMRLTEPLRFHFSIEPSSVRIVDSENLGNRNWIVDYTQRYAYAVHDYAIIARYKDQTTGGNIIVIAGIGAHATQAASEFVGTSKGLEQIQHVAARGWEEKNLELIVETDIINGDSGPPRLIATTTW